ncbi:retinitis pigmentosa 9 protein homolog [Trichonephila inaurata madagascariensis]|uniref:Retinitis pigmentosa 9 protein homolog n=1 Tax=Trichonephila inaurata madagascariensis TaxID=2747483 RepID=A0A8X7BTP7_9ARAC|nr:retinitis pigmentosa 9 protein homolog [Trichonephila inaurata madagascariensis]
MSCKKKKREVEHVQVLKHYDTFYSQAPPGLIKEDEEHPEDCIPDLPENREAREFLSKAPSKGLWMPLGKEVKIHEDPMHNFISEKRKLKGGEFNNYKHF